MTQRVSVSRSIQAGSDDVYALVSDVTRMGDWSPETTSCKWTGGAEGPAVGAGFRGANRNGWHRWMTKCRVSAADPGRTFAFDVSLVFAIANWAFTIEAEDEGCRVTETWTDRRNALFHRIGWMADGVRDRATHNREGMSETLSRLAAVAEGR